MTTEYPNFCLLHKPTVSLQFHSQIVPSPPRRCTPHRIVPTRLFNLCALAYCTAHPYRNSRARVVCKRRAAGLLRFPGMAAVMAVAPESVVQGTAASGVRVASWAPEPAALKHVVGMLSEASSANSSVHESLYRQLESYATNSDFNNYLAHILVRGVSSPQNDAGRPEPDPAHAAAVRQVAGLLLKNNMRLLYKNLPLERQTFINDELLRAVTDQLRTVRASAAICIATIVSKTGFAAWPDLIPTLKRCLDSGQQSPIDGALTVLCRLAEDIPHLLDQESGNALDAVVPKIIIFCSHPTTSVRAMSLQIMNHLLLVVSPMSNICVDAYCQALFRIADDNTIDVRKRVCTAICLLLQAKPDALAPYMRNIIEYMLISSKHHDEQVALEACEFWNICAKLKDAKHHLVDYVPQLVAMLLDNMVYSDSDRALIGSTDEHDNMVPDRPEDIRPRFHQPRLREIESSPQNTISSLERITPSTSSTANSEDIKLQTQPLGSKSALVTMGFGPGSQLANTRDSSSLVSNTLAQSGTGLPIEGGHAFGSGDSSFSKDGMKSNCGPRANLGESQIRQLNPQNQSVSEDDNESEDGDAWEHSEDVLEWSVRKSSASSLEALAWIFSEDVLAAVLARLNDRLSSDQWEQRECAVLALGAIASGCYAGMESHLRNLFPFLIHLLSDPHYMVRSITCWTLSRYAHWVVHRRDDALFEQLLACFLQRVLDHNKTVQKAACSALSSFEEEAGHALSGYLKHILPALVSAFGQYQVNNLVVLYDSISTLADAVGRDMGDADHLNVIMPPLINKWNSLADTDEAILPLLECLSCVFRAIEAHAQQFAPNVLARCVNIIEAVYKIEAGGERHDVHVEFLTCSLDLMCGLTEAMGPSIDPLVANSSDGAKPLLPLLFLAMRDRRQEVRQSAFALVGEFARSRLPSLIPALHEYVQFIISALDPEYMSVSNNATWALGEMVMMAGFLPPSVPIHRDTIKHALVEGALDPLIRVVNMPQLNKSLLENTAITLGRMGLVIPDAMAPRLGSFARAVFLSLRDIRDDSEKEQAAHGMNALVKLNPTAIFDCFAYYVDAIASWYYCKPDLEADFAAILSGYKLSMGEQWYALFRSFSPALQSLLKDRFKL